jgi:hypothetical protein
MTIWRVSKYKIQDILMVLFGSVVILSALIYNCL